jgi:uncharacterized membrane protein
VALRVPHPAYDPRRAIGRAVLSGVLGAAIAVGLSLRLSWLTSLLTGWNAGGALLMILQWLRIGSFGPQRTAERAAADDPGRTAVYVLVVLTSAASLLAAIVLVRGARAPAGEGPLLFALCLSTVVLSWTLTHTAFTLRYAHLYYRDDAEGVGGVEFPGGAAPSYLDFAYLAFTIGMCFQVSDSAVTGRQVRRAVLFHATLSFFYNTAILAFVLNLILGRAT